MAEPGGHEFALALGELHGKLTEELTAYSRLPETERTKRAHDSLAELRSKAVVTEAEESHLRTVLATVRNVDMTDPQIADEVSRTYQALKAANAGDVALALASIAADSTRAEAERSVAEGRGDELGDGPIGAADCEGGIIGATVALPAALLLKDPALVLAGAVGGAVAGSVAEALSE
jgi:hypothetical protein